MSWKYLGSCIDGERFEVEGVDVWSREWIRCPGELAEIRDPLYNEPRTFSVYELALVGHRFRFAAGEFSNCVWGFYAYEA